MSALGRALLRVDPTAPVTVNSLASLSPAELAVASLRPDLDVFVRQRAYLEFLFRRNTYRKSNKRDSLEQPLFDHPLDFALPDSPTALSPAELVLVPFNRRCTSLEWADEAAQLFLLRASQAREREGYAVSRCEMSCDGGAWVDKKGVTLAVEPEALVVRREREVLFKILAHDMTGARRFAGRRAVGNEIELEGFEVEAQQVALVASAVTVTNVKIAFVLARPGENGPLLASVASWSRAGGFHVEFPESSREQNVASSSSARYPPRPTLPPPPPSAPRSRSTTLSSTSTSSRPRPASGIVSAFATPDGGANRYRQGQDGRSVESLREERDGAGAWQFVDTLPEHPDWHPGELSRQIALLRAIAPDVPLHFVSFTLDDLALLSHRSRYASLPRLPANPPDVAPGVKHVAVERLGLEHIYRFGDRINLSAERLVLLTHAYPDLKRYAVESSKLVAARDALVVAYGRVLADLGRRESGQQASDPREPVARLVDIVLGLRDAVSDRYKRLYDADGRLIRSVAPSFSEADLGKGAYARFERALGDIVRAEERAGSIG
ncbi:uncharacterized protein RHOBADRAFT_56564 [Rhodotorula graminis WP1]|uniref:Uncharacterized protein n=1 Tax=Rhodotorula graminis (strain WP1) TaxID=578459 RepID=A0A0N8PZ73_RHOGW|nr:uncharacterized protein RHOBADRAFT_56564 [Rhodotorula graminis WP1]KPV71525.1 hypothetical protein RHOBADRAFT_56564 [Rhodotorula graminis WP1]